MSRTGIMYASLDSPVTALCTGKLSRLRSQDSFLIQEIENQIRKSMNDVNDRMCLSDACGCDRSLACVACRSASGIAVLHHLQPDQRHDEPAFANAMTRSAAAGVYSCLISYA